MQYMYVIRFHDKSIRVIIPKQAQDLKYAMNQGIKCAELDGDFIALSSISRIESSKYLIAELPEEKFNVYGYPHIDIETCRDMLLLPLTLEYLQSEEKKIRRDLACLEEMKGKETKEEKRNLATKYDYPLYASERFDQLLYGTINRSGEYERWIDNFEKKGLIKKQLSSPLIHANP